MLKYDTKKISVILLILLNIVSMTVYSDEVNTRREMIEKYDSFSSQENEPFIFMILQEDKLCLEKILESYYETVQPPKYPYDYQCITQSGIKHYITIKSVIQKSLQKTRFAGNFIRPYFKFNPYQINTAMAPPPTPPDNMRYFFHLKWDGIPIGCFSYGHRFGNMKGNSVCFVYFLRGNIDVQLSISFIPFHMYSKGMFIKGIGNSPGCGMDELFEEDKYCFIPNLREIAWKIDQYLKNDPLEKLNDEEKQKLKTLAITLPKDVEFEQGKEYPLDFPRKSSDGTIPAEIRLVVSRGEIQQVIVENTNEKVTENPSPSLNPASLVPDVNGQYTVLLGQPEKQTVHCYHIDKEGKCFAWGKIEVQVCGNIKSEQK